MHDIELVVEFAHSYHNLVEEVPADGLRNGPEGFGLLPDLPIGGEFHLDVEVDLVLEGPFDLHRIGPFFEFGQAMLLHYDIGLFLHPLQFHFLNLLDSVHFPIYL